MHWMDKIIERVYASHMGKYQGRDTMECTEELTGKVVGELDKVSSRRLYVTFFSSMATIPGAAYIMDKQGMGPATMACIGAGVALWLASFYYSGLSVDIVDAYESIFEDLHPRVQRTILAKTTNPELNDPKR